MRAIQLSQFGGPEVLEVIETPMPVPAPGQVLVRLSISGVNFAETLMRENRYAFTPPLPCILGSEAVGTIYDAAGCEGWSVGQKVTVPLFAVGQYFGGYAEYVAIDAAGLVAVPDTVSDEAACALQVQGLSALALTRHVDVKGKVVLVNAAAGGVGTLLIQLLKLAGASKVIAASSSDEKRALTLSLGADVAVDYTSEKWLDEVLAASNGAGPDVIFESAGGSITSDSLKVLGQNGAMVIFGALNIQSFQLGVPELLQLIFKNQSIRGFAVAPMLTPEVLRADLAHLFQLVANGSLDVHIGGSYPFSEIVEAHRALGSRKTMGKIVLQMNV
ncbi:MAG: NADPH:quinone oxidoreductase family protein [Burkholderiaceae bacterium]|nr:NADPH:quinone oxidoreductase family protein [Burkholderiaceae bacterium]